MFPNVVFSQAKLHGIPSKSPAATTDIWSHRDRVVALLSTPRTTAIPWRRARPASLPPDTAREASMAQTCRAPTQPASPHGRASNPEATATSPAWQAASSRVLQLKTGALTCALGARSATARVGAPEHASEPVAWAWNSASQVARSCAAPQCRCFLRKRLGKFETLSVSVCLGYASFNKH